jgi:putative ABC transport system ATP-binding protein
VSPVLELRGVTKDVHLAQGTLRVIDHVDLDIAAATCTVISGPSGAGKSTLLHLMGALDRPTTGSIRLEMSELTTLSDHALSLIRRRRIGFVFQFFNLLPNLTMRQNIALPLLLDGVAPSAALARAATLAGELGLEARLDTPARLLSGGELQRAALARALVHNPALLLADEPTGNLDSASGRRVLELLREAVSRRGRTLVLVTHDPAAWPLADRHVQLIDGRIVNSP